LRRAGDKDLFIKWLEFSLYYLIKEANEKFVNTISEMFKGNCKKIIFVSIEIILSNCSGHDL
jgi:hypothetical protein